MDLKAKAKALAVDAEPTLQEPVVKVIPDVVPGRVCEIDGDFLAYFAAGGDNMAGGISRQVARERIEKFRIMTGSERARVHLSSGDCTKGDRFLIGVSDQYQGQRAGKKPKNWHVVRQYLEEYDGDQFEIKFWRTREADDGAAYCCETLSGGVNAVVSKDKDWRMFAGLHCDWDTFQLTQVNPGDYRVVGANGKDYGHYFFWWQMLRGDQADHIPGIPGLGEKTASKLLADTHSNADALNVVVDEYKRKKKQDWAHYFVEQAALLWMRTDRHADILDFVKIIPTDADHQGPLLAAAYDLRQRVEDDKKTLEDIKNGCFSEN